MTSVKRSVPVHSLAVTSLSSCLFASAVYTTVSQRKDWDCEHQAYLTPKQLAWMHSPLSDLFTDIYSDKMENHR
ncbi:hypothetical protein AGOR_G00214120 [Albula goreensis]|uniref:Uncharacterized protein n=1 Tax=Albula goreensis TaxID=1534307 RepID=A0A8T3CNQ4_9TELE|nr:hypothetical protein AGOR_G00214120 [Albula goreensis]